MMHFIFPYFWNMKKLILLFLFVPICMMAQSNFEKAEKLFHAKKYDEAKVLFEGILKTKPVKPAILQVYRLSK